MHFVLVVIVHGATHRPEPLVLYHHESKWMTVSDTVRPFTLLYSNHYFIVQLDRTGTYPVSIGPIL